MSDNLNCMTVVVGRKASATGRVILAHNEDDNGRFMVNHSVVPARDYPAGAFMPHQAGRADVPQVSHTSAFYWMEVRGVSGGLNASDTMLNEHGVFIVSDSAGHGVFSPDDDSRVTDGGIVYNLRRAVAERATSARQGMELICRLAAAWGYGLDGRLYIVADRDEAFVVQLMHGKHYMAARVPDDCVAAIPNHYVIRTLNDADEIITSPGLIDAAVSLGACTSKDDFDFYTAFQKGDWRHRDANVWRQAHALKWLTGRDYPAEHLPFAVRAERTFTVKDIMDLMSSHYEGTEHDLRFGPGATPHDTGVTAICRGTTVESSVTDFADDPRRITLWTAFGRPCQQLYVPIHPNVGFPRAIGALTDPAASLDDHLNPWPDGTQWRKTGFQRLRDVGNMANFFHTPCACAMRAFRDEWYAAHADQSGDISPQNDEQVAQDAIERMERFAREHYSRADVSIEKQGDVYRVSFTCDGQPQENALLLCVGCMNIRTQSGRAVPGSLTALADGRYQADFPAAQLCRDELGVGPMDVWLAGSTTDGGPFAGMSFI